MKKVCVTAMNSPVAYSGGRYHAWILVEALVEAGYDVTYWTNAVPLVSRDFRDYPAHSRIKLHVDPFFSSPPKGHFDFGWIIPHYDMVWIFARWVKFLTQNADRRLLLNFETPNWYAASGQIEIDPSKWTGWDLASRFSEAIVSSLEISSNHARKHFTNCSEQTQFLTLPPSINSLAADRWQDVSKNPRRIFLPTRMNRGTSSHKGSHYILEFLIEEFRGYELVLLLGGGSLDRALISTVRKQASDHGIQIRSLRGVSDVEKYRWLSSSTVSVFLSSFEGFGYPPIESLYCGTPCIAFDLPNYDETCGIGLARVKQGDIDTVKQRIINRDFISGKDSFAQACQIGSFPAFVQRTRQILEQVASVNPVKENWEIALNELSNYQPSKSFLFWLKTMTRSRIPHQAVVLKRIWESMRA